MASRKRSARQRRLAEFRAELGGLDDAYARAERRDGELAERREAVRRERGCESKARYATHGEAEEAIAACAAHGRRGLRCYRCEFCGGWHLTSRKA